MDDPHPTLDGMVDRLVARATITRPDVEQAFRRVPRHRFLPSVDPVRVYTDGAIVTKVRDGVPTSSSSDPAVMAIMLEQLDVRPGASVLEIGAGTGYNAAVLAELIGPTGRVVTVDLDDDVCTSARRHLQTADYGAVEVECRDGAFGVPERGPYDRIIVTAGVYEISRHWFDQLKRGGVMVLPLWIRGAQGLVAFERLGGSLRSRSVRWGGFMRLRGSLAGPETYVTLPNGWMISADDPAALDVDQIAQLLDGPWREYGGPDGLHSPLHAFAFYLATQDERVIVLTSSDETGRLGGYAVGLFDAAGSLALIMSLPDEDRGGRRLLARSYGDLAMSEALEWYVEQWTAHDRPGIDGFQVIATPVHDGDLAGQPGHPGAMVRGAFALDFSRSPPVPG